MYMMARKRRRGVKDMLIPDPLLLSRLNKYLEAKKHEVTIDQNKMVEDLRANYREYERKDKTAFRASVFRAYNYILEPLVNPSSMVDNEDGSSVESCSNDEEILDSDEFCDDVEVLDPEDSSSKNNGNVSYLQNLQNMANPRMDSKSTTGSERESNGKEPVMDAIDISSDEDGDTNQPTSITQINKIQTPQRLPSAKPSSAHIAFSRNFKTMGSRTLSLSSNPISISLLPRATLSSTPLTLPYRTVASPLKRKAGTPLFPVIKRRRDTDVPTLEQVPKLRLKDFGGHEKISQSLSCLLQHMRCPEVYCTLGISPPVGFLLHGPPGSGKTLLAHCIAGELHLPLLKVVGPELISGISGESEQRIRSLFDSAAASSPCVLFIDEIDAISQPRESASKDMERRIVAQLLASFDDLQNREGEELVIVIGATNRADSLDPALRRAGRFDREIIVGMPDRQTRCDILRLLCDSLRLSPGLDLQTVAAATPGYVGADLKALTTQAAYQAVNRFMKSKEEADLKKSETEKKSSETEKKSSETEKKSTETKKNTENKTEDKTKKDEKTDDKEDKEMTDKEPTQSEPEKSTEDKTDSEESTVKITDDTETVTVADTTDPLAVDSVFAGSETLDDLYIEADDFINAVKFVQPSAKREGFATVPDVTWSDIGSLDHIREQLNLSIMMPVKYPEEFAKLGVTSPTGILLCGPPGCGKTLLAKAVANEANINFISVKGPELLNMYVGESEKAVRQVFQRARNSQPCVIFFDEIDALCPKRSDSAEGGGRAGSRVVNQLLTEMDGVEGGRLGVYMMAATNRPDMLDPAVLRPGRFDKLLYVGLPSASDRALILKAITKKGTKPEFTSEVDLEAVGSSDKCEGFSGADLAALVKESSVQALCEYIRNNRVGDLKVSNKHINSALAKIKPSVSPEERIRYEVYRVMYTPQDPAEERMDQDD